MTKTYTVELQGDDGEILPLPDELCEELGWMVGDTLNFEIEGDAIIIRKAVA